MGIRQRNLSDLAALISEAFSEWLPNRRNWCVQIPSGFLFEFRPFDLDTYCTAMANVISNQLRPDPQFDIRAKLVNNK